MNFIKLQRCFASSAKTGLLLSRSSVASQIQFTSFQTSAALTDAFKTPIQQWGAAYLDRQKATHRPLSPHINIYQPQLTWWVSGAHRILGCVMGGVLVVFMGGMIVMPFDFTALIEFIHHLGLPAFLPATLKFIIAFPLCFHLLNGIRFLGFDMAYWLTLKNVYLTGYMVMALSFVLALLFTFWRKSDEK